MRGRRQLLDDYSNSLTIGLRLRLAVARQRVTEANAHIASFDLRGRAAVLRRHIDLQRGNLRASLDRVVTRKHRALNLMQMRFAALDLRARVAGFRRTWERDANDLQIRFDRVLVAKRRRIESAMMQFEERSPFKILERGYSIAYDASGKVLRSADQVTIGDEISLRLARGELAAKVSGKNKQG